MTARSLFVVTALAALLLAACEVQAVPNEKTVCPLADYDLDATRFDAVYEYVLAQHSAEIPRTPWQWAQQEPTQTASGTEFANDGWVISFDPPVRHEEWPGSQRIIVANKHTGLRWDGEAEAHIRMTNGCNRPVVRVTETSFSAGPSGG